MLTLRQAKEAIEKTTRANRPIRWRKVREIADSIKAGTMLPSVVVIDDEGNLLDGQHRVRAVLLAGEDCEAISVTRGTMEQVLAQQPINQTPRDITIRETNESAEVITDQASATIGAIARVLGISRTDAWTRYKETIPRYSKGVKRLPHCAARAAIVLSVPALGIEACDQFWSDLLGLGESVSQPAAALATWLLQPEQRKVGLGHMRVFRATRYALARSSKGLRVTTGSLTTAANRED